MKMKRLVSAIAALAMSVSAFAGFSVAHADTTTLYERGYETAWTAEDATTWTATLSEATASDGVATSVLFSSGNNSSEEEAITVTAADNSIINVEALIALDSNTGRYLSNGNASYFRFGDVWFLHNDQDKKIGYSIGAFTSTNFTAATDGNQTFRADIDSIDWYNVTMEIDTAANTLNYLKVYNTTAPNTAVINVENAALSADADYSTVAFGYQKTGSAKTDHFEYLKAVKVTETTQTVETADYTINYVCGEDTVKTVANTGVVGQEIDAETVFVAADGTKYFAADGATTSITLAAGENVLNVAVREANKYTVTANATGTVEQTLATIENVVEGESATYSFPRYIADGTALNQAVLTRYDQGYQKTVSGVVEDTVSTVEYAAVADTTVAFYSEAEDIEGVAVATSGNIPVRCSDSAAAYFADDAETEEVESTLITTLPAGKYVMTAATFGNTGGTFVFSAGDTVVLEATTLGYFGEQSGEEFTLTEETAITVAAAGNAGSSPKVIDYILIKKTGDVEAPTLTTEPPIVEVEEFGEYTEYEGNPAKAYTGTFTVDPTKHYPVSSVTWYVGEASTTTDFDTVISGGTVVTGLVVVAEDLSAIPTPLGYCGLYYGE